MSANEVYQECQKNDASMSGNLPSSQFLKRYDHCCGIHGAARKRKGFKRGKNAARRRFEKRLINDILNEK